MNILWLIGLDLSVPWYGILLFILAAYTIHTLKGPWKLWRLGIPQRKLYPFIGSVWEVGRQGLHQYELNGMNYPAIHGEVFTSLTAMVIRDMDLVKEILIKDFANFTNRPSSGARSEYPMNAFLTVLKGEDWRRVRNIISPTFSAGKMKIMARHINDISGQLEQRLQEIADKKEYFNSRELSGAYTMDVIARTTFGLQVDTLKDPKNQFMTYADQIMNISFKSPAVVIAMVFPFLVPYMKYVGLTLIPKDAMNFFLEVTKQTISNRESKEGDKDFLQLMMDAHREAEGDNAAKGLSEAEVLAQGLLFFIAGYDTTQNTLAFLLYHLAAYQDVQDQVFEEIQAVMGEKTTITYDDVHELQYLDMCLSESLRIYPIATRVSRECRDDRTYNGVYIPKGMNITVPVYALHMDPEIWPEPKEFRPERFSPEEKAKRSPYMYAPFGHGPRNCVGMRLALMEIKMAVVAIIRKFRIVTGPETEMPPKLQKVRTRAEMKLKLEARE